MNRLNRRIGLWLTLLLSFSLPACSEYKGMRSRINTQKAIVTLKAIRTAEEAFRKKTGNKYGTLEELTGAGLIDSALITNTEYGYRFALRVRTSSYEAVAVPLIYGKTGYEGTGHISLYLDDSGVIRGADKQGGEADAHDDPLIEEADKK